jgi:hypothetical protein
MKFNLPALRSGLDIWSREITQFKATLLITQAYIELGMAYPEEIRKIAYDDGTVDHKVHGNNNQQIFHRWRKCKTSEQREKFEALAPAILKAMPTGIREIIIKGESIELQTTRQLKEHTDVINAILLKAPLPEFERECAEFDRVYSQLKQDYRAEQQRHDQ